jgi:phenylacetate-CoA ligase
MNRLLRSAAHDILSRRDGMRGWRAARRAVHTLLSASPDEVGREERRKLTALLDHAFRTVPYYRETWERLGFFPTAQTAREHLAVLPLLPKEVIQEEQARLTSEVFPPDRLEVDYTSGTTGSRTSFYRDPACRVARVGRQWGILEHCGYRPGDRRGLIWGVPSDLPRSNAKLGLKARFRRFAGANETLCCRVMSQDDMRDYHRRLAAFRPAVLYGYPNAIAQFARFVQREQLTPIRVARIFCTAEKLHDEQRALFQDVFGGEVVNLYCSREHGCVGFECPSHHGLHIDTGSVAVEIVSGGGPAEPGESGELVLTDLLNYGMPLIRHATGDLAAWAVEPCGCGCPLPLITGLDGKEEDILYRPDGSIVAGILFSYLFTRHPSVSLSQFVQEDETSLDVYLVADEGETETLRRAALAEVQPIMGPEVHIRVHFVSDIPRNPRSGKFRQVVCKIKPPVSIVGRPLRGTVNVS